MGTSITGRVWSIFTDNAAKTNADMKGVKIMKKKMLRWVFLWCAIMMAFALLSSGCAKTEVIKKDNNFTVMPLPLILTTTLNVTYTRAFHPNVSGSFMFAYKPPVGIINVPVHSIGAEFDLYFWPRYANTGFFVGPYFQVSHTTDNISEGYLGGTGIIPGLGLGWRWMWDYGFNIGLGASIGYAIAVDMSDCPSGYTCTSNTEMAGLGNWAPRLLFDLGYAF